MTELTYIQKRKAVQFIVREFRRAMGKRTRPMPLREFAKLLSQSVSAAGYTVSHQTVKNWEDGAYFPDMGLVRVMMQYPSWQGDMAQDVLAIVTGEQPLFDVGARAFAEAQK